LLIYGATESLATMTRQCTIHAYNKIWCLHDRPKLTVSKASSPTAR
jgi:hypothetical protein